MTPEDSLSFDEGGIDAITSYLNKSFKLDFVGRYLLQIVKKIFEEER